MLKIFQYEFFNLKGMYLKAQRSKLNKENFIKRLSKYYGIKNMDDWYNISFRNLLLQGGAKLLAKNRFSVYNVACSLFPEHNWKIWKFSNSVPNKFWNTHRIKKKNIWIGLVLN